jgi:hypothetical protein
MWKPKDFTCRRPTRWTMHVDTPALEPKSAIDLDSEDKDPTTVTGERLLNPLQNFSTSSEVSFAQLRADNQGWLERFDEEMPVLR